MKKKEKMKIPEKGRGKMSFFGMLLSLSIIPLVLSISFVCIISVLVMRNNLNDASQNTLYIVANNLASYCDENNINAINASDYYEYLDSLKDQNIEMAIIIEGTPCTTSIKNENDYRVREIEVEKNTGEAFYDDQVEIDGKQYCAYYTPIYSDGEMIGLAFAGQLAENVTGAVNRVVNTIAGVSLLLVVIFVVVALLFSKGVLKSFRVISQKIDALANGDLADSGIHKSKIKEMGTLLEETSSMRGRLSEIIGKVKMVASNLVTQIEDVTELSKSSSQKAEIITYAVKELSVATTGMAENVQEINGKMMEIGNCVNEISDNVDNLTGHSENILQTNNEAKENMNTIMENSRESVEAVRDIARQIEQTNDSIAEIDMAVELILSISDQTSLLSLNASIEAARAGEHGKGFAVVAEEIRNLSDQSAKGAEMIKKLAQDIIEKSNRSVELTHKVHSLIETEQENVSKTQEKYEELSGEITRSVEEIHMIADKIEILTGYKENVIGNVQDLSAISEENAASNTEVSANIEDIIEKVQLVNHNCETLSNMADELAASAAFFKTE